MDKTLNIALLLAGGQGHRMHSDLPKQFMEVEGKPVIFYTMQAFQNHPDVDRIYVVCHPEWAGFVRRTTDDGHISKFCGIFPAGDTSIDSLRNGIEGLRADAALRNPVVLTHEAVRPLVTTDLISRNLSVFREHGNAITAVRSNEAYMVSPGGMFSEQCIPRERLYRAQTPITFRLDELSEAFSRAARLHIRHSQSLYTLMAEVFPTRKLYIAPGTELNFKLTLPEDIETLKALIAYRTRC